MQQLPEPQARGAAFWNHKQNPATDLVCRYLPQIRRVVMISLGAEYRAKGGFGSLRNAVHHNLAVQPVGNYLSLLKICITAAVR